MDQIIIIIIIHKKIIIKQLAVVFDPSDSNVARVMTRLGGWGTLQEKQSDHIPSVRHLFDDPHPSSFVFLLPTTATEVRDQPLFTTQLGEQLQSSCHCVLCTAVQASDSRVCARRCVLHLEPGLSRGRDRTGRRVSALAGRSASRRLISRRPARGRGLLVRACLDCR